MQPWHRRWICLEVMGLPVMALMNKETEGLWYYQQVELGFNYRMTELQAALGVSQMHRLTQFVEKRHTISNKYNEILKDFIIFYRTRFLKVIQVLHLYVIRLKLGELKVSRKQVFEVLHLKVCVNVHYILAYAAYYENLGFKLGDTSCS